MLFLPVSSEHISQHFPVWSHLSVNGTLSLGVVFSDNGKDYARSLPLPLQLYVHSIIMASDSLVQLSLPLLVWVQQNSFGQCFSDAVMCFVRHAKLSVINWKSAMFTVLIKPHYSKIHVFCFFKYFMLKLDPLQSNLERSWWLTALSARSGTFCLLN